MKEQVNRNLADWEGVWTVSTAKEGEDGGFVADFLDNPEQHAEIVDDNFGSLTVDKDGYCLFYFKNNDFSEVSLSFTAAGYLIFYGDWHLVLMGVKIIESLNPDYTVGEEICNDGKLVMALLDNSGKKRIIQLDNFSECGFLMGGGIQWFILEKQ